ncbi:lysylphosphatidylglycerol synthase domain-containing protein [Natranaerobius trueperi]|uniref:Uncharacterized protein n=1 Tax=Natranaerobius trueperi TaxID=759412 RepID=A0A226C2Y3_9FIRM|nr:lysylphosphatidylglycerol synthase domain-containing protein [Natranaerobius trueperi]OWZ84809.1 hypothetical protein CDO51_01980 [Natranaerobius trueperi]
MKKRTNYGYCKQFKNTLIRAFKILFFIGVLIFLVFNLPEIIPHIKTVSYSSVTGLVLMQLFTLLVIAYQWKLCDKVIDYKPNPKHPIMHNKLKVSDFWILNSYGKLCEGITPGVKTGGEGLKTVMLVNKFNYKKKDALILVLIQKSISLVSFVVVLAALCVILSAQGSYTLINYSNISHLLIIITVALILLLLIVNFWGKKSKLKYFLKFHQIIVILRKKKLFVFLAFY